MMKFVNGAAVSAVLLLMLAGCPANLWYSGSGRSADFSIELSMPSPDELTPAGRALALQGTAIYVEILSIENTAVYANPDGNDQTLDNAFLSVFDSNGEWVETNWGGYAAKHITASGVSPVIAGFTGIPADKDLMVRVVQEASRVDIDFGSYGELYPISQSYNPDAGAGPSELLIRITPTQLRNSYVDLPIRPHPSQLNVSYDVYAGQPFDPMVGAPLSVYLPGSSGETEFWQIELDMFDEPFNDPGMLVGTRIVVSNGTLPPGIVHSFDATGRRLPLVINRSESFSGDTWYYYFGFAKVDLDFQFGSNSEYFLGVTVRPGVVLDGTDPDIIRYDLLATPLVNAYINSNPSYGAGGEILEQSIEWDLPNTNDVLRYGDLEFKVVHWYGTNLPAQSVYYDVQGLNSLNPQLVMDWNRAEQYFFDNGETSGYFIPDILGIPGISLNPQNNDDYISAVLARFPGGPVFLIAVETGIYVFG